MNINGQRMIPEVEQETTDFDWFAVDENGLLSHFTTAGFKLLPKSVAESAEDLKIVTSFFEGLDPNGAGYQICSDVEAKLGLFKSDKERARYLLSFSSMAERGFYSFDINTYVTPGVAYFRVAIPLRPLHIRTLPEYVCIIVERTKLTGVQLSDTARIDYQSTLTM